MQVHRDWPRTDFTTQVDPPQLAMARQILLMGGTLIEASQAADCFARDLDLALWRDLGRRYDPMFD